MSGVPSAASLPNIICDLFQNEQYKKDNLEDIIVFSALSLSDDQIKLLNYPIGFTPLNVYLLYQVDHYQSDVKMSSSLSLVSFVRKETSNHIYAYYFDINGQDRFRVGDLIDSSNPVILLSAATFTPSTYIELYNTIKERTVILGHSSNPAYSSLQYSECGKYYYETLTLGGIGDPSIKEAELMGLSQNLNKYNKEC